MKKLQAEKTYGFTLIEVLVALFIAIILVGSAMALIGTSLRNSNHVNRLRNAMPVLDAAAQEIIRNPGKALTSPLVLTELPDSPSVTVEARPVEDPKVKVRLYRVTLKYGGETLVTSVIVNEQSNIQ